MPTPQLPPFETILQTSQKLEECICRQLDDLRARLELTFRTFPKEPARLEQQYKWRNVDLPKRAYSMALAKSTTFFLAFLLCVPPKSIYPKQAADHLLCHPSIEKCQSHFLPTEDMARRFNEWAEMSNYATDPAYICFIERLTGQAYIRHDLQLTYDMIERRNLRGTPEAATVLNILFPERSEKEDTSLGKLSEIVERGNVMTIDAVLTNKLWSPPPITRRIQQYAFSNSAIKSFDKKLTKLFAIIRTGIYNGREWRRERNRGQSDTACLTVLQKHGREDGSLVIVLGQRETMRILDIVQPRRAAHWDREDSDQ